MPAVAPGSAAGKKGERVREMGVELWHVGNALRALRALRALLPEEGVGNGEALGVAVGERAGVGGEDLDAPPPLPSPAAQGRVVKVPTVTVGCAEGVGGGEVEGEAVGAGESVP